MDQAISTLDLDDLNAKQLRKLIKGMSISSKPHHEKSDEDKEEDESKAQEENSSKVDLHREKGDDKGPKVEKDDLPEGLKNEDEDESKDEKDED
jgi:hypothetical protein